MSKPDKTIILDSFYIYFDIKKALTYCIKAVNQYGGVRETRTLAPVARPTSLAGRPLHHLGITP